MAVSVVYASNVTITETIANNAAGLSPTGNTITYSAYNTTKTLNSGTTPPVSLDAVFTATMSAGTLTIDLTSLTSTNGATVSFSGLKVQFCKVIAPIGNANTVALTQGAANPYLLGGTSFSWVLSPGQEFLFYGNNATPAVGGSAKTLLLTGTGSQALNFVMVAG